MTTNKKLDSGGCMTVLAFAVFLTVAFFIIGGWLFSTLWAAFVVPVFGLPTIDIGQGIAAIILLWLSGWALRGNATSRPKVD